MGQLVASLEIALGLDTSGASASAKSFGDIIQRSTLTAAQAYGQIERATEAMAAGLAQQTVMVGRAANDVKYLKAETRALAAETLGQTEAASRLRQVMRSYDEAVMAAAASQAAEAARVRDAGIAHQMFEARVREGVAAMKAEADQARQTAAAIESIQLKRAADEHMRLAAAVQGSHAAQEAEVTSLEALRRSVDPLLVGIQRLEAELAESTRLYYAGATGAAEYGQQQRILGERLEQARVAQDAHNAGLKRAPGAIGGASHSLTQLSFQLNDVATMWAMNAKPQQIIASQLGQIIQIVQMTEGGLMGLARMVGALVIAWWPLIAAVTAGVALFKVFQSSINEDAGLKAYANTLGLTHKEMKKLGDVSVTTGDMLKGIWTTVSADTGLGAAMSGIGKKLADGLVTASSWAMQQVFGIFYGGAAVIEEIWRTVSTFIGGYISQGASIAMKAFQPLIDIAQGAAGTIGRLFQYVWETVAGLAGRVGQFIAPILSALGLDKLAAGIAQMAAHLGDTFGKGYVQGVQKAVAVGDKLHDNIVQASRDRLLKKRNEIVADRTPKADTHAADLAREAEATEAQIKNLLRLAEAYRVSDAAALIAEARAKAESAAIRKRGDVEEFVSRQIRLAVAQRVSDGAKAAADMRVEADAQRAINDEVMAGLIPAARAADALRDFLALRALQAAQAAAVMRGDVDGANLAAEAIADLQRAQAGLNDERRRGQLIQASATADDELDRLRLELSLIGATDAARTHSLATLKAEQEARAAGMNAQEMASYVAKQVAVADATQKNTAANDNYNESLRFSVDLMDQLDREAQNAASRMADAFGNVGRSIGDALTVLSGYAAAQESLSAQKAQDVKRAGNDAKRLSEIETLYAQRSASNQMEAIGGLISAGKGLFSQHSKGYKAMEAAEKVYAAFQAAQTIVHLAAGAAKMFGQGGFGGFAGVAAMAAVMAGLGVAFSGGSGKAPESNQGTGTVLGDNGAKSESIQRSLDLLNDLDAQHLHYASQMAASLKSIEGRIGNLASLIVRSSNIDASAGVQEGFQSSTLGKVLGQAPFAAFGVLGLALQDVIKKIPVIGDILGGISGVVKSLFGSKTTVVGNGLYGGAQSVGSIVGDGFDLSTYSDIQKKKKFFGITTGTSYSTQYGSADDDMERQFGLILKGFYSAIAAAAPPLGEATQAIEDRLKSMVIDIGRIDLKGLSGEEINEKLTAVFGAAADNMARTAFPGLEKFQQVGEGAFETLVRVASSVETVTASLRTLGLSANSLGVDVSMAIVGMFDSASDYASAANAYFSAYYTETEQTAAKTAQLTDALGSLGLQLPDSIANYRKLVEAQDLTTAGGQEAYAALLKLGPAFADLNKAVDGVAESTASLAEVARQRADLERQMLELSGDETAIRAADRAKIAEANLALYDLVQARRDEVKAAQDAAAAAATLASAREGLERQLLEVQGNSTEIRRRERDAIAETLRPLYDQIVALKDLADAATVAAKAAEDAAARQRAIADQQAGLNRQLLEAQGNIPEIRRQDLAALLSDEARATQQQLYDIADRIAAQAEMQRAAEEAQRAAEEADRQRQQAAEEAARAANQLADAWRSIADTLLEEVKRIRGMTSTGALNFAQLQGQFNSATTAARMGDQDAGKSLPGLSRDLLDMAAQMATSRQELARVQAETASSLEETARLVDMVIGGTGTMGFGASANDNSAAPPAWWTAASGAGAAGTAAADALVSEVRTLRQELEKLRSDNNDGNSATAAKLGSIDKTLSSATGPNDEFRVRVEGVDDVVTVKEAA